jgi:hypothetical protein
MESFLGGVLVACFAISALAQAPASRSVDYHALTEASNMCRHSRSFGAVRHDPQARLTQSTLGKAGAEGKVCLASANGNVPQTETQRSWHTVEQNVAALTLQLCRLQKF